MNGFIKSLSWIVTPIFIFSALSNHVYALSSPEPFNARVIAPLSDTESALFLRINAEMAERDDYRIATFLRGVLPTARAYANDKDKFDGWLTSPEGGYMVELARHHTVSDSTPTALSEFARGMDLGNQVVLTGRTKNLYTIVKEELNQNPVGGSQSVAESYTKHSMTSRAIKELVHDAIVLSRSDPMLSDALNLHTKESLGFAVDADHENVWGVLLKNETQSNAENILSLKELYQSLNNQSASMEKNTKEDLRKLNLATSIIMRKIVGLDFAQESLLEGVGNIKEGQEEKLRASLRKQAFNREVSEWEAGAYLIGTVAQELGNTRAANALTNGVAAATTIARATEAYRINEVGELALAASWVGAFKIISQIGQNTSPSIDEIVLNMVKALRASLTDFRAYMDARLDRLEHRLPQLFYQLDDQLARVELRSDEIFDAVSVMNGRLTEIEDQLNNVLIAINVGAYDREYERLNEGVKRHCGRWLDALSKGGVTSGDLQQCLELTSENAINGASRRGIIFDPAGKFSANDGMAIEHIAFNKNILNVDPDMGLTFYASYAGHILNSTQFEQMNLKIFPNPRFWADQVIEHLAIIRSIEPNEETYTEYPIRFERMKKVVSEVLVPFYSKVNSVLVLKALSQYEAQYQRLVEAVENARENAKWGSNQLSLTQIKKTDPPFMERGTLSQVISPCIGYSPSADGALHEWDKKIGWKQAATTLRLPELPATTLLRRSGIVSPEIKHLENLYTDRQTQLCYRGVSWGSRNPHYVHALNVPMSNDPYARRYGPGYREAYDSLKLWIDVKFGPDLAESLHLIAPRALKWSCVYKTASHGSGIVEVHDSVNTGGSPSFSVWLNCARYFPVFERLANSWTSGIDAEVNILQRQPGAQLDKLRRELEEQRAEFYNAIPIGIKGAARGQAIAGLIEPSLAEQVRIEYEGLLKKYRGLAVLLYYGTGEDLSLCPIDVSKALHDLTPNVVLSKIASLPVSKDSQLDPAKILKTELGTSCIFEEGKLPTYLSRLSEELEYEKNKAKTKLKSIEVQKSSWFNWTLGLW